MWIFDGENYYEGGDGRIDSQPFSEARSKGWERLMWDADLQRRKTEEQAANFLTGIFEALRLGAAEEVSKINNNQNAWNETMWQRSEHLGQRLLDVEGRVLGILDHLSRLDNPPPGAI